MNTRTKQIGSIAFAIISAIMISQCKSRTAEKNESDTSATDTITVNTDTKNSSDTKETASASTAKATSRTPLILTIMNLESSTAPIVVGVYGTKNKFPDPKDQFKEYQFKPRGKKLVAKITNLKFGEYAMAIYQDENGNGKIDKNILGIPTECYGFSNNYKPMIKAPRFDNCEFEYSAKANTVSINLIK